MDASPALEGGMLLLVLLAALSDWRTRRIPNPLLLSGLALALLLQLLTRTPLAAVLQAAMGAGLGLALFLPLYLLRGMAAGDVKLLATVGAFSGPLGVLDIALASCCLGGLMAVGLVLVRGKLSQLLANLRQMLLRLAGLPLAPLTAADSVGNLPYGLAIAAGTVFVIGLRHLF